MALDAHDDGLISVDGFRIDLKKEEKFFQMHGAHMAFSDFQLFPLHVKQLKRDNTRDATIFHISTSWS